MKIFKNQVWVFKTDYSSFLYCRFILIDLINRFPFNQDAAIKNINSFWGHLEEIYEGNMIYHELPEYWSSCMYWGDTLWWKKGDERTKYNLSELKPHRFDNVTKYELWEPLIKYSTDYIDDFVFADNNQILGLIENGLMVGKYHRKWEITASNYREALQAFHSYKGWEEYREMK